MAITKTIKSSNPRLVAIYPKIDANGKLTEAVAVIDSDQINDEGVKVDTRRDKRDLYALLTATQRAALQILIDKALSLLDEFR